MSKLYTVQSGDTLSEIAEDYSGVSYQDIYNANRDILDNPNEIYPGQKLDIPSSEPTAETSSEPTVETSSISDEANMTELDWDGDGLTDELHFDDNNDGVVDTVLEANYEFDDDGSVDSVSLTELT